jgi:hypothetical protein
MGVNTSRSYHNINIACNGRTVIASIHESSNEVFAIFDYLY